jgi:L-malate glycosyltransferase
MQLAIWNTNYLTRFGGAERAVHNLLNRFSELGIQTFLITRRSAADRVSNRFFGALHPNVQIYQDDFDNPWDFSRQPLVFVSKLFKYLKSAVHLFFFLRRNNIQIVHLHYVSWDILLLAICKVLFRYRLVITFRAGEDLIAKQVTLSRLKIRLALRFADRVTAVSKDLCDKLETDYLFRGALHIPNGVSIKQIQQSATPCAEIKDDNFVFCGRFAVQKRLPSLIATFNECLKRGSRQNLYLVGDGEEMAKVKALIKGYGITSRVMTLGALSHAETLGVIKQSRCLLLASSFEGLPQVVLEAMALGKPVIVTDVGGLKDLVVHGETGYLCPVDRQDILCDLIMKIAANKPKADALGAKGLEVLAHRYDLDAVVQEYLTVYRSLGVSDYRGSSLPRRSEA